MLRLKNITKDYGGADNTVHALKGISLDFRKNEFVSILGQSGCGKTTLLNIIGGLDKYTSGDLEICGVSTKNFTDGDWDVYRNHRIGFVFQSYNLIPHQTILGNVEIALTIAGVSKAERKKRAAEALKRVGLEKEMNKKPNQLSGGQMQRVAIARALVTRPELVVCDEAVSALDASVQAQVLNLLKEVQADFGLTYFFISHDLSVVGYMSDRVAVMYLGRIVEQADRNTLFGSAAHPYTKALLAAAPVHDPAKRRIRAFLPGELPSPFSPPTGCAFHPRCPQAMPRCREEAPELREIAPDHLARCHLYG